MTCSLCSCLHSTQTFSLSDLSLAEEIVDTDNGTADVGGDTECAVAQESAYLRALLSGLDRSPLGLTCVWEDNAAAIAAGTSI